MSKCQKCGLCCEGNFFVQIKETDNVPKELLDYDKPYAPVTMKMNSDHTCIAFNNETRECSINDNKPESCRRFTAGAKACNKVRTNGGWNWINEGETV